MIQDEIKNNKVQYWHASGMSNKKKALIVIPILIVIVIGIIIATPPKEEMADIAPPIQKQLIPQENMLYEGKNKEVNITLLAKYTIKAVVKSKKNYNSDSGAIVSPMDLALAWGDLNKKEIDKKITYSQRGRWYYYRTSNTSVVSVKDIGTQSANTHIIPSNEKVLKQLKKIRKNDLIELQGYLVSVEIYKGQPAWTSSLTREDIGNHACEIMYVTNVKVY